MGGMEQQDQRGPLVPTYVSRTRTVAIAELEPFIVGTITELMREVEAVGPPFTIYHGEVNDEADGTVEVCVPTAERLDGGGALPAGLVVSTTVEGAQTAYPEILSAFDAVADWAQQHGHGLDGPPREIYLSGPGEPERMEISWPVRWAALLDLEIRIGAHPSGRTPPSRGRRYPGGWGSRRRRWSRGGRCR